LSVLLQLEITRTDSRINVALIACHLYLNDFVF